MMDREKIEKIKERVIKALKGIAGGLTKFFTFLKERIGHSLPKSLRDFLGRVRRISADKVLWIWALVMILGFILFKIISGNIPGMGTTLVFAQWWEDELESQILVDLAAEFEGQNPGITIQLEKMSWPEIREWLEADEEEKKKRGVLDIFSLDSYSLSELKNGVYPAAENEDLPVLISFINPLFYNIDLLKASGFNRPPKNQTEFLSYVQRISQSGGGAYGAGLALGDQDPQIAGRHLLSWIWAAAGNPETAENFRFNIRELTAVLNFLNQLKQNLYSNPFRVSEEELIQAFSEGRIGMMIAPVSDIRELKTKLSDSFGITTIPGPESYMRKPVFPLTVWYAGVNQQSEHPEEAEKFISFLRDKAGIIAAAAYAVPGNGRRNPELSKNDPYYAKAFDMYEAGEVVREYRSPELFQLSAVIRREVELMFAGTKSPEQCAEAIQQRWEALSGAAES